MADRGPDPDARSPRESGFPSAGFELSPPELTPSTSHRQPSPPPCALSTAGTPPSSSLDVIQREIDDIERELGSLRASRRSPQTPGMEFRIMSEIQDFSDSPPFLQSATAEPRLGRLPIKTQLRHRRCSEVGGASAAAGAVPTSSGARRSS